MCRWRLIIFLLSVTLGTASASALEAGAKEISEVRFSGLKRVEEDAVRAVVTARAGQPLNADAVTEDVRAVYAMGFFRDVRAFASAASAGAVRLTYRVEEKPAVQSVDLEGYDELSEEDIREVIDIRPFTILSRAAVRRNARKIRDLYREKGYYLADVASELQPTASEDVRVVFKINERAKIEVRSIRFFGNDAVAADVLRTAMVTKQGDLISFLTGSGTFRQDALDIDVLQIQAQYFDRGYINVKVSPPDVEISPDRKFVHIGIRIEEGEQYSVGKISVAGDILGSEADLLALVQTKSGEIFNRSLLQQDLLALKRRYEDDGYAYANITPLTSVQADDRIVDLSFEFQKGEKVYYERINVIGNTKTRDKVVRRELRIYEGELTSATLRERSRARVMQLGYFEKVDVRTRRGSSDRLQIVDIEVKERATGTFQVGAGFSSVENFILTAQVAQENFLGRGQSIALQAQLSSLRQLFSLRFTEPYLFDSRWTFGFNVFNTETNFNALLRAATGGDLTFGYPLTDDDVIRLFLTYSLEFVRSGGAGTGSREPFLASLNNQGRISSLRAQATYDTRNNRLFPSRGMYHSFSHEVSAQIFGASDNRTFHRTRAFTRYYHPLIWGLVGRMSISAGYLRSTSAELAPSEKFRMGGINTVRGYGPFSIGPERRAIVNDRGLRSIDPRAETFVFTEGGNKEFQFNAEVEFPIFEAVGIRGVVFLDAGNVFAEEENFFYLGDEIRTPVRPDAFDVSTLPLGLFWSWGFGFRWFSPIGPLRFEWGVPLTRRPGDPSPLFEFSIGNSF